LLFCSLGFKVAGMAAPLPLPALHATHAGIWLSSADGEVREASRKGAAILPTLKPREQKSNGFGR